MDYNLDMILKVAEEKKIEDFSPKLVRKANTTFEFDNYFTLKFHLPGEPHINYYRDLSCSNDVFKINKPMLFIHSKNDPICL